MNTQDYRNAPSGIGPQAGQWADKPHRLVYDLCREVERLSGRLTGFNRDEFFAGKEVRLEVAGYGPYNLEPAAGRCLTVHASTFSVTLPEEIVNAIVALHADRRWNPAHETATAIDKIVNG